MKGSWGSMLVTPRPVSSASFGDILLHANDVMTHSPKAAVYRRSMVGQSHVR
jgi:hypothetical protein